MTLKSVIKSVYENSRLLLDKDILAYWWKPHNRGANNWGDVLNPILIQEISRKKPVYFTKDLHNVTNKPVYAVIGSILQHNYSSCGNNLILWGPGFISDSNRLNVQPRDICAVRGPLTRDILLNQGYHCPEIYGDPALLYPKFYKPEKRRKYKLGVIPHFYDKNCVPTSFMDYPDVLLIDIHGGINQVVDQICSCSKIASSSLHGIIAADAYGVPSKWIKFSDNVIGDGFKFFDYFYSVGRVEEHQLEIKTDTSIDDILDDYDHYKLDFNINDLWDACPFKSD